MKLTAIILAGGKSSRMGEDKGLVKLKGKAMVEHVIAHVKKVTRQILIIANKGNYKAIGFPVFADIIEGCGPMGGIYTGLMNSENECNLVLSCDIPFVNPEAMQYIIKSSFNYDITVPVHAEKEQPLCAVYKKSCAVKFHQLLLKQRFKMKESFQFFKVNRLDVSGNPLFISNTFENINAKTDLQKAEEL